MRDEYGNRDWDLDQFVSDRRLAEIQAKPGDRGDYSGLHCPTHREAHWMAVELNAARDRLAGLTERVDELESIRADRGERLAEFERVAHPERREQG